MPLVWSVCGVGLVGVHAQEHFMFAVLYMLFVLLATITVMNMLIGVLCEAASGARPF